MRKRAWIMSNLEKIKPFLCDYKRFSKRIHDERITNFQGNFEALKKSFLSLKEELAIIDKKEACRYNIFDILNIRSHEAKTHTPFLKNLLEANGTHGQGNLFLISFIKKFIPDEKIDNFRLSDNNHYIVDEEKGFYDGRIDLYIYSSAPHKKFGIVIENKIYAGDQQNQIERYYGFLQSKQFEDKQMMLFYLTIDGREPSEDSIDEKQKQGLKDKNILYTLSYKKDIKAWLEDCQKKVEAPKVNYLLEAYLETIVKL